MTLKAHAMSAITALSKENAATRSYITDFINKQVARAQLTGEFHKQVVQIQGCLSKASSLKIDRDSMDEGGLLAFSQSHFDGLAQAYKDGGNVFESGAVTLTFSVEATASFFIGVSGNVGINLEIYDTHLLFRPCAEAKLTLGLSVGAAIGLNFGMYFGDSEYGNSANFQPGGTVSAGVGLKVAVLIRLGPAEDANKATIEKDVVAQEATTSAEQAPLKKTSAIAAALKKFGAWLVAKIKGLKNSALVGFVFGLETGYKIESKIGLEDSAGKAIGDALIDGTFGWVCEKVSSWCKAGTGAPAAKCKKLLDALPSVPSFSATKPTARL
jgi:hypothetical protein